VVDQLFDAGGKLDDVRDVKVASTNASLFAYVANGRAGLAVLQLTSPEATPGYLGFSPRPAPRLIATRRTHGPALALSKGLDRDRAADESGNQVSVFNRLGARPLNAEEAGRLYLRGGGVYTVTDQPPGPPRTVGSAGAAVKPAAPVPATALQAAGAAGSTAGGPAPRASTALRAAGAAGTAWAAGAAGAAGARPAAAGAPVAFVPAAHQPARLERERRP
jgi:hypothetical protein